MKKIQKKEIEERLINIVQVLITISSGLFSFFIQKIHPDVIIDCIARLVQIMKKYSDATQIIISVIIAVIFYGISKWVNNKHEKKKKKRENDEKEAKMKSHFPHSLEIVQNHIIPTIKDKVAQTNDYKDNNVIDNYIQSPLEYVNETLHGNKLPEFDPNHTYQNVIFKDEIKYIVAITAENPNLFLNPSIGFYMSNCYAVSLIRQLQDFIKKPKHTQDSKLQLVVKDIEEYKNEILPQINRVINTLKDSNKKLETFEFVRFFIFDEHQNESCKDTIFPSLKASQDLFRTISFYIQKNELEKDNKWEKIKEINKALWDLIGKKYEIAPSAMDILNRRKDDVIPEFLLVFYDNKIEIHTYLGGMHYSWDSEKDSTSKDKEETNKVEEKDKVEEKIRLFTKLLADYVSKGNGQLRIADNKENQINTFIDWEWENTKKNENKSTRQSNKRNKSKN